MGRDKIKRELKFKPLYTEFKAKNCNSCTTIHLLHEEMEAIYLMDVLELYQADAAKKMGVSRPTFARIIKSARSKVAMSLVTGATLKIEDEKEDYIVAIATNDNNLNSLSNPNGVNILLFHIHNKEIIEHKIYKNPANEQNIRPGQILPKFLNNLNVNFFITNEIGMGLKEALKAKGIFSFKFSKVTKEQLLKLV